jgi:hypothetical protein
MSIYSGFATRAMETSYNKVLCSLMRLCSSFISSSLKHEQIDAVAWSKNFSVQWTQLHQLDSHKYLPPKLSYYCLDLAQLTGAAQDQQSMSQGELDVSFNQLEALILEESRLKRPIDNKRLSSTPFSRSQIQDGPFLPIPERVRTSSKNSTSRSKQEPLVVRDAVVKVHPMRKINYHRSVSPRRRTAMRHQVIRELPEDFYAKAFLSSLAV